MVNPGSFRGKRKAFLTAQLDEYTKAVPKGDVADILTDIQRRYFKRFPPSLPHDEDPSDEALELVDDDSADPEDDVPSRKDLSDEAFTEAMEAFKARGRDIAFRKKQIARWLAYRYAKNNQVKPNRKFEDETDPIHILTAKLAGVPAKKPRRKTPYNIWGPRNRFFVDPIFEERVKENNVPAKKHAALRQQIYKELFEETLEEDERQEWLEISIQEHANTCAAIDAKMTGSPASDPQDRQDVIQRVPAFAQPMLDLLAEFTGWKFTLIAGGPEPADGGRLNIMSLHSGTTSGSAKMNFGRAERSAYKEFVLPVFAHFLKKCYSIEECRASALPLSEEGTRLANALSSPDTSEDFNYDSIPYEVEYLKKIGPHIRITSVPSHSSSRPLQDQFASANKPPAVPTKPTNDTRPLKENSPQRSSSVAPRSDSTSSKDGAPTVYKIGPPRPRKKTPGSSPLANNVVTAPSDAETPSTPAASSELPPLPSTTAPHSDPSSPSMTTPNPDPISPVANGGVVPPVHETPAPQPVSSPGPQRLPDDVSPGPGTLPSLSKTPSPPASPGPGLPVSRGPSAPPLSPSAEVAGERTPFVNDLPAVGTITDRRLSELSSPVTGDPENRGAVDLPAVLVDLDPPPAPPSTSDTHPAADPCLSPSPSLIHPNCIDTEMAGDPLPSLSLPVNHLDNKDEEMPSVPEDIVLAEPDTSRSTSVTAQDPNQSDDSTAMLPSKRKATVTASGEPTTKRGRTYPEYVTNGRTMFEKGDFGPEWRELVEAWIAFEEGCGFKESKPPLGSKGRPKCVPAWIKRARSSTYTPNDDTATIQKAFVEWWRGLQPKWRVAEGGVLLRKETESVEQLRCSGPNGLLSVIAALFFWRNATKASNKASKAAWMGQVDDALWVLRSLHPTPSRG